MDCVCGHESLIRPACVHIYSTTMRLTVCQTEPQTTTTCNPKHYFPVNQQLCCLACSFHDIFSKPKNSEKNKSAHTTRKILFGLQSCVDFICFSLDSHTLLFEAAFWQSVSISSQNTSNCVFTGFSPQKLVRSAHEICLKHILTLWSSFMWRCKGAQWSIRPYNQCAEDSVLHFIIVQS